MKKVILTLSLVLIYCVSFGTNTYDVKNHNDNFMYESIMITVDSNNDVNTVADFNDPTPGEKCDQLGASITLLAWLDGYDSETAAQLGEAASLACKALILLGQNT